MLATCAANSNGRAIGPPDGPGPAFSFFEFWPTAVFYLPVALYWLRLAVRYRSALLPTAANPLFAAGGLCAESKAAVLGSLADGGAGAWVAPFVALTREGEAAADAARAEGALSAAGLALPVVAKPDLGCRGAGVRLIENTADLHAYLAGFPQGERLVLQRYVAYPGEAGVLYARLPGWRRGRILSLALKYFPEAVGDGRSTLRQLIYADARARRIAEVYLARHGERCERVVPAGERVRLTFVGNHFRGAVCRDANALITAAMTRRFEAIARAMPEFYFGRFDVRFRDLDALRRGEDFLILEVNGAGAEPLHIWDCRARLAAAYRAMLRQTRLLFEIGHRNRARGFQPMRLADLVRLFRREQRLFRLYPLAQ